MIKKRFSIIRKTVKENIKMNRKKKNRTNISKKIDIHIKERDYTYSRGAPSTKNNFATETSLRSSSFSLSLAIEIFPRRHIIGRRPNEPAAPCLVYFR